MSGPLAGIRVIDLTIAAAGPYATGILASQGAEVIKIERPDGGDFMRGFGTVWKGVSALFAIWNRGKRSIALDLKKPEAIEIVRKLVATADVLVHNLRPGAAETMGIGYAQLRAVKPDLVYVFLTGWGETGPRAGDPAYDSVVQAAADYAANQADPATGVPRFVANALCDKTSGLALSQLITAALLHRARTGEGQRVHMSMLHSAIAFLWPDGMQSVSFLDREDPGGKPARMPPVRRTLDGWMSLSANLDAEFRALCRVLGIDSFATDARFAAASDRSRNGDELWAIVDPILATRTTAELAAAFAANRIPHAVVNPAANVHEDPQVKAIDVFEIVANGAAGRQRVPRPVGDFSTVPLGSPASAPALGADTGAVLEALGYDAAAIARLRSDGVIS